MADSIYPDQIPHSAVCNLSLHCLLQHVGISKILGGCPLLSGATCMNCLAKSVGKQLRVLYTPGRSSTIFDKGDNFCDLLFAFLCIEPILEMSLL